MAKFERSRERKGKRDSRGKGGSRNRDFEDRPRGRRDSNQRGKRDFEMTQVTCSSCGVECEVPFKPTSNKPVYCSDCFEKQGGKGSSNSNKPSSKDFDIINEKLDKIIKALEIE